MITVRELVELPHLRARVIAGRGGLDREISWVHTSDLPNPWDWHGDGELLLTNGTGLDSSELGQLGFLQRMCDAGASGLAFGLGMPGPKLLASVLDSSDDLDLPLLSIPIDVSFTAIVRAVADANEREEARQLGRIARLYELLRASVISADHGPEMLQRLGQELGVRLYMVDPKTGGSLFDDSEDNPFGSALADSYLAHRGNLPAIVHLPVPGTGSGSGHAVAVSVPGVQPTTLIVESMASQIPSPVLLQHIATGAALELAQLLSVREYKRNLGANLLTQMLDRGLDTREGEAYLNDAGLDLAECVLVLFGMKDDFTISETYRRIEQARVPHMLVLREGVAHVLLPLRALFDGDHNVELPIPSRPLGVSDLLRGPGRAPDAANEARWALGVALAESREVVEYGDEATLLLPRTPTEARVVVGRILDPLIEHDATHGSEYLNTLRAIISSDRSWQQAAATLNIHKQTLGYRIHKIEALSGRSLTRTADLAHWWFALRAYDLLIGREIVVNPDPATGSN